MTNDIPPYLAKLIKESAFHNPLPVIDVFDTDNEDKRLDHLWFWLEKINKKYNYA